MSAPRTEVDKQARRHWASIAGVVVVVVLVLAAFLWWFNDETHDPDMPVTSPDQTTEPLGSDAALPPAAVPDAAPGEVAPEEATPVAPAPAD